MVQPDKRKQMLQHRKAQAKQDEILKLPMNEQFINAMDEEGELIYPYAVKLRKWIVDKIDEKQDVMRQILGYIDNIRYSIRLEEKYASELKSGKIVSKNKEGVVMSKEELYATKVACRVNQYRDLSRLRIQVIDKLLPTIDGTNFTGEQYNDYIAKTDEVLKSLGFNLLPDTMEIIWPE